MNITDDTANKARLNWATVTLDELARPDWADPASSDIGQSSDSDLEAFWSSKTLSVGNREDDAAICVFREWKVSLDDQTVTREAGVRLYVGNGRMTMTSDQARALARTLTIHADTLDSAER